MPKDKSGYGRMIKVFNDVARTSQKDVLAICTMKTATTISYKGIDLSASDYMSLDSLFKFDYSSSDGAAITTVKKSNIKAGDNVLVAEVGDDFILLGKVI